MFVAKNTNFINRNQHMNFIRHIKASLFVLLGLIAANTHAGVIVDFENFGAGGVNDLMLSSTFQGANTDQNPPSFQTLENTALPASAFGMTGGIRFSGGVLLQNPTETGTMFPDVAGIAVGSVFYATANAPSSDAVPENDSSTNEFPLSQAITISITEAEAVTSVQGILINGLATTPDTLLAEYSISYFSGVDGDVLLNPGATSIGTLPSNQEFGSALFGFDTTTLTGMMMGALITRIEITTPGVQFPGTPDLLEYDFLIDALSFNQPLNPIPVPAAFPLFLSALIGGWLFARPRKPSESIH